MADQTTKQRLAAVLAADVVGYTRLMEEDTEGTVAAWQAARDDIINPTVADHSGRVVKLTGDGFLAEFPTVHEAVKCGIAMQQGFAASSLEFRIGINLGDIIDDGQDIHGEGVNIAARIEALADPGGICISSSVHEQVRNRIEATYEDRGEQRVKNVSAPVRVFAIGLAGGLVASGPAGEDVADKPAIAVLPFDNLSGDPEQEYFSDGITEDIITALSRWRHIPVIARNSTFVYKGQAVDVTRIGTDLGAQYVLEGSVRKSGERVRITAQLIEAASGQHVWAEHYDRSLEDIFALQDEITERIVTSIDPAIRVAETQRAIRKPPESLDSWDHFLRGQWHANKFKKDENAKALQAFQAAIKMDPNFALAHAWLSISHFYHAWLEWSDDPRESLSLSHDCAKKAIALDDMESMAHVAFACANIWLRRHDAAISAGRRAIQLNPSSAPGHFAYGTGLIYDGQPAEAIPVLMEPMRLSPNDPLLFVYYGVAALARLLDGQHEGAVDMVRKAIKIRHGYVFGRAIFTAALAHLGQTAEAEAEFAEIMRLKPEFSAATIDAYPFRVQAQKDHLLDGLHKAGLPEG